MNDVERMIEAAGGHHAGGRLGEAEELYRAALAREGGRVDARCGLGVLLSQTGRHEEALGCLPAEVVMGSGSTLLLVALAGSRLATGDAAGAAEAAQRAVAVDGGCAEGHNTLGAALLAEGKLLEAVMALKEALKVRPGYAEAYYNLGRTLQAAELPREAVGAYDGAVRVKPGYAQAWLNRGFALRELKRLDEAGSSFRKALTSRPGYAAAMHNLGVTLAEQGQAGMGVAWLKRAVEADPANAAAHSALVYLMMFDPACGEKELVAEARRWQARHGAGLAWGGKFGNERDGHRKLKVGYVSPDFRGHAESRFVLPLLEHHDREQYEVHCYASVRKADEITAKIGALADGWHEVRGLTDAQLAERIRGDGMDVLVDLTMHMEDNRLGVFARRAAPVQVSWLAYPGVTGLGEMDGHVTDRFLMPGGARSPADGGQDARGTGVGGDGGQDAGGTGVGGDGGQDARGTGERFLYMPESWFCYQRPGGLPEVGELPALSSGMVTFGSLNTYRKVSPEVLGLWARLMGAVEEAGVKCRLVVVVPEGGHREELLAFLKKCGVGGERVELVSPLPFAGYVGLCGRVDMGLDTFPHGGATTTLDLLNMGVPVLSLRWPTPAGRLGESILTTAGLEEWVAGTAEEFVAKGVRWAKDRARLANVRAGLREKVGRSALMDGAAFARGFEGVLREAWQGWCGRGV